jgi:hypothetical protein
MNALTHYQGQAALAELQRWQGIGLTPKPGCNVVELPWGDSSAWIEYRYTPGRPGRLYGPPEDCHEDEPADIELLGVLLNGTMCEPTDVAPDFVIDEWAEKAIEHHEQKVRDDSDAAAESAAEARAEAREFA